MRCSGLEVAIAHDTLFEVYTQAGTGKAFGFGPQGDDVFVVELGTEACVTKTTLKSAVSTLSKKLRAGYTKSATRMFFNSRSDQFTHVHPDLDWKGGRWILAATPNDVAAAVEAVADVARTAPASQLLPEEVAAWVAQQKRNCVHVVAFDSHPVWVLALAQTALEKGWGLRTAADMPPTPDAPPSAAPLLWKGWLLSAFEESAIRAAQAGMGWTLEGQIVSDNAAPKGQSLSAFI